MSFIAPRLIFENHNCKPCNVVGYLEVVICRQPTEVIEYNQQTESIEYTDIIPKSIITDYVCPIFVKLDNDGINVRFYINNHLFYIRLIVDLCSISDSMYQVVLYMLGNYNRYKLQYEELMFPLILSRSRNRHRSYSLSYYSRYYEIEYKRDN